MSWDDEPVGDDEALAVLQSDRGDLSDPKWEPLPEDPHWLTAIGPPWAAGFASLVLGIGLAPKGGWLAQHVLLFAGAVFLVTLGVQALWHRSHAHRSLDDRCRAAVVGLEVPAGPARAPFLLLTALASSGMATVFAASAAGGTGQFTPIDEERSFPLPSWLIPLGCAQLLVGAVGCLLLLVWWQRRPTPAGPRRGGSLSDWPSLAVLALGSLAGPIIVGVAATESASRWVPLVALAFCAPVCVLVVAVASDSKPAAQAEEESDEDLLDREPVRPPGLPVLGRRPVDDPA
jgi:hypothetical protein